MKAGAPVPSSHCAKKAWSSRLDWAAATVLDVRGADGFVGVLREEAAEELEEDVVAHLPAEHVEDHRALLERHGLELRGEGIEAADGGEGFGVVGEGAGGDVGDGGLEGVLAGGVFEVHQLGVAGHAVGDPGVVHGGGRDLAAPPLMGEGVGEQALLVAGGDAVAGDGGDLGRPGGGDGVVGELDEVHVGGFGLAEGAGHVEVLALGGAGEVVGGLFASFGDVDAHVADGDGVDEFAGDDGAGEAGLGPFEGELGAVAGEALLRGDSAAAADDALIAGDADVHLGGEAVGEEAGHGEPAAGIEQDADGVFDGGELDAFDGAGVGVFEGAGVLEVIGGGGAFGEWGGGGEAHGVVVGQALVFERLALGVGRLGDLEAVVQLEGGVGELFERGEGDVGGGGEAVYGGVEVGVDDVAGDLHLDLDRRGPRGRRERGTREEESRLEIRRMRKRADMQLKFLKTSWYSYHPY